MAELRAALALCLAEVQQGASLNQAMPDCLAKLPKERHALAQQLVYGSLRDWPRLVAVAGQLINKPLRRKDADIYGLILCGLYQLAGSDKADHAIIDNSVEASVLLGKAWAKGLVNAVLRNFQRRGEALFANIDEAAGAAHPAWLYGKLKKRWPDHLEQIITANNQQPPVCLRVNRRRISREDYALKLDKAGIAYQSCSLSADGLRLSRALPVSELPGFAEGEVSIQDEAAQIAAGLFDIKAGQRLLDACAAPGGKSCHLLERYEDLQLVALDIDQRRNGRIHDNLERLSLNAEVVSGDAAQPENWWDGRAFDHILLDAPCSATGVIRRHPDIKIHRQADDISNLVALQVQLLRALWPLLAPGGVLVYATCSVLPEENKQQMERFLAETADAREQTITLPGVAALPQSAGIQLLPEAQGADGFYYCRVSKTA